MKRILPLLAIMLFFESCGPAVYVPKNEKEYINLGYLKVDKDVATESVSTLNVPMASGYNNIYDYIKGRVPGVEVNGTSIIIRGINSINLTSDPLILVDGVATDDISWLSPDMVQSIDVLKDASSTAMYGSRGGNGVILITTRRSAK